MNKLLSTLFIVTATICACPSWAKIDYVESALAKQDKGDNNGALADYAKGLRLNVNDTVVYNNRAMLLFSMGDRKRAFDDINHSLKINPIDSYALSERADFKNDIGDYKGAEQDYTEALKWTHDKDVPTLIGRGIARSKQGKLKEAQSDFEKALAIEPNNSLALFNHASILASTDPNAARSDYEKLTKLTAKSAEEHFTLGNAHLKFGKPELGLTEFDKAIQLDPGYALAYYNRAVLREEKGDKVGALDDYNKAIKFDQNNPKAYFNRYLIQESMGDQEAATNDLNRALQLDPEIQAKSHHKPMKLMQS